MKRLDFAVPVGLMIGLVALGGSAALEGIKPKFLWQPTAALVVLGGTIGAVAIRRGMSGLISAVRATYALFFRENTDELEATFARLGWLARAARRDGVRVFESYAETSQDPLVTQALTLASEYAEPAMVRASVDASLDDENERGLRDAVLLEAAGGYAPTFGILGAILGLIQVLRSLADPGALGPGIATAFVATIYGITLANLVLLPLAARLRERHELRMRQRELLGGALVALAANESPSANTHRFAARSSFNAKETLTKSRKVTGQ